MYTVTLFGQIEWLSTWEHLSPFSHDCVESIGEGPDEVKGVGFPGCILYLGRADIVHVWRPINNVFRDWTRKEGWFLAHWADLVPEPVWIQGPDIMSVQVYRSWNHSVTLQKMIHHDDLRNIHVCSWFQFKYCLYQF